MRSRFIQYITTHTSIAKPVSAISLDMLLQQEFGRLEPGIVLDVGSEHAPHKKLIPAKQYLRLDSDSSCNPHICCDLHAIQWKSEYYAKKEI